MLSYRKRCVRKNCGGACCDVAGISMLMCVMGLSFHTHTVMDGGFGRAVWGSRAVLVIVYIFSKVRRLVFCILYNPHFFIKLQFRGREHGSKGLCTVLSINPY